MTEKEITGKMKEFWEKSGKSKAKMSSDLEVDPGTFANILNGNRGVSATLLSKFLQTYPEISADWLLRGEGEMLRQTTGVSGNNNVVGSSHDNYSNNCREEYYALKGQVELLKELLREKLGQQAS